MQNTVKYTMKHNKTGLISHPPTPLHNENCKTCQISREDQKKKNINNQYQYRPPLVVETLLLCMLLFKTIPCPYV